MLSRSEQGNACLGGVVSSSDTDDRQTDLWSAQRCMEMSGDKKSLHVIHMWPCYKTKLKTTTCRDTAFLCVNCFGSLNLTSKSVLTSKVSRQHGSLCKLTEVRDTTSELAFQQTISIPGILSMKQFSSSMPVEKTPVPDTNSISFKCTMQRANHETALQQCTSNDSRTLQKYVKLDIPQTHINYTTGIHNREVFRVTK